MPKRMFEFVCVKGHNTERFVDTEVRVVNALIAIMMQAVLSRHPE